jgi:hypothetical protein
MAKPEDEDAGDAWLVFSAHNTHHERCGSPPRLRNSDNTELYYGYFENRYGEQFVFTFDRATGAGTASGGDLGWGEPRTFTRGLLDEALRSTQTLAAQVKGSDAGSRLPVIDTALALGRLTGLTGKDEIVWLRACLETCAGFAEPLGGPSLTLSRFTTCTRRSPGPGTAARSCRGASGS